MVSVFDSHWLFTFLLGFPELAEEKHPKNVIFDIYIKEPEACCMSSSIILLDYVCLFSLTSCVFYSGFFIFAYNTHTTGNTYFYLGSYAPHHSSHGLS